MDPLWLLKGGYEAPGWKKLERESKADEADVMLFDRTAWALVRAPEPPRQYEGLDPIEPPDGMYIDPNGVPAYLVGGEPVAGADEVVAALGDAAAKLLDKIGDPVAVLERLGRTY